jgi:hypothetical protein
MRQQLVHEVRVQVLVDWQRQRLCEEVVEVQWLQLPS